MAKRSSRTDVRRSLLPALWHGGLHALVQRVRDGLVSVLPPELVREKKRAVSARYRPRAPQPSAAGAADALSVEAVDALVAQLMASSSWQARAAAALSLGQVHSDGVVQALVRALRDPSVEVAVAAAEALTHQEDVQAEGELLAVIDNRDGYFSPVTRVAAISALSRRLPLPHFGPVFAALRDIDAEVSIAAVAVIAERMQSSSGTYLLPLLRDQSGYFLPIVRLAAANALEHAGVLHSAIAQELLHLEHDPAVRRVLERAQYLTDQPLAGE